MKNYNHADTRTSDQLYTQPAEKSQFFLPEVCDIAGLAKWHMGYNRFLLLMPRYRDLKLAIIQYCGEQK